MSKILSQASAPTLHGPNYGLSQSDSDVPPDDSSVTLEASDVDWGAHSYTTSVDSIVDLLSIKCIKNFPFDLDPINCICYFKLYHLTIN